MNLPDTRKWRSPIHANLQLGTPPQELIWNHQMDPRNEGPIEKIIFSTISKPVKTTVFHHPQKS